MDLLNETGYPADLFRSVLTEEEMLGTVVAKATYRVEEDGRAVRDFENPVPVSREPIPTPFGELPGDAVCRKEGVDLFALGQAYAPGGRPTPAMEVRFTVGSFTRRLAVLGDRRWRKGVLNLGKTEPEPFSVLPLTWDRAFGGQALLNRKEVPHADNPKGRGYILDKAAADGTPLPNLEDPDAPILSWEDKPRPLCFAPLPPGSYLHAEHAFKVDEKTGVPTVLPSFFNCAHPKLRIPEITDGVRVELVGMTPGRPLAFAVPILEFGVEVSLADRHYAFPARADTLCVLAEERRFFVVYRAGFTYRYVPEEERWARLRLLAGTRTGGA